MIKVRRVRRLSSLEIICPPTGTSPNPIDLIATQEDDKGVFL